MTGAGDRSAIRRAGYALVGRRLDYLLHLRPAEWPIMAAHTALGAWLAWTVAATEGARPSLLPYLAGLLIWVVCLNGGTLAINSAFDHDEGDVAYLRRPPPPPRHLFAWGMSLMVAGLALAVWKLPATFAGVYAACLVMSVLYSVPPFRLKAVAGADWIINMIGFGALTPIAGWSAGGTALPGWALVLLAGFCPLFAGFYPLTQLYQMEEDRARGDRTLALSLGASRSVAVAIVAVVIAFVLFGIAASLAPGAWQVRAILIAAALLGWLAVLVPWYREAGSRSAARHQRGMYLALGAWAVTDLAIAVGWRA